MKDFYNDFYILYLIFYTVDIHIDIYSTFIYLRTKCNIDDT